MRKADCDTVMMDKDIETYVAVNQKVIDIQTEVKKQNDTIISLLTTNNAICQANKELTAKLVDSNNDIKNDIFKLTVLYVGSLMALIGQIISVFIKH